MSKFFFETVSFLSLSTALDSFCPDVILLQGKVVVVEIEMGVEN